VGGPWHLAQVNVATLAAPIDSPRLATFVERLAPVNALADRSPGFVWRLQGESGDATSMLVFDDVRIIVNLSVWESFEALRAYVFSSDHADVLRRRREWFEQMVEAHLAMWWIRAGTIPTVEDAKARLETLRERGPSLDAFAFREPFPAPAADEAPTPA
jgi:heme-degrading monooxygenase HmoA